MIIQALMSVLKSYLNISLLFEIPSLPDEVYNYIDELFDYLASGAGLLANYVPLDYLFVLFGVLLAVDAGILIYHFVMWVLKKIPMASIS